MNRFNTTTRHPYPHSGGHFLPGRNDPCPMPRPARQAFSYATAVGQSSGKGVKLTPRRCGKTWSAAVSLLVPRGTDDDVEERITHELTLIDEPELILETGEAPPVFTAHYAQALRLAAALLAGVVS